MTSFSALSTISLVSFAIASGILINETITSPAARGYRALIILESLRSLFLLLTCLSFVYWLPVLESLVFVCERGGRPD
jgi:hypothetical protein